MLAAVCIELGWQDGLDYLSTHHVTVSASWVFFWIALGTAGLFDSDRPERIRRTLVAASVAVFGGMLLVAAFLWVTPWQFAHPILLVFGILALAAALAMGWIHRQTRRARFMTSRCLVIGTNGEARRVIDLIHRYPRAGLELIGLVHCGKGLERPGQLVLNYPVLGTDAGLPEMIRFHRIDTVIVAAPGEVEAPLLRRLRSSRYRGVAVADYVSLYEELAQEIPVDAINDEWLFAASMNSSRPYMRHFKRAFDVIASIVALTLAAPLVGVAAVLVALDSPGPILYRQERLGRDGVPFTILKFRTMAADAEGRTGPVWATANDPRVTRVGRWLRRFRIDEMPQLINVLRGEMSLIGPRPERQLFVTQLHEQIPFYAERAMVRPGISGWAQVRQPYAASIDDSRRKLQADLYYIKHVSFTTDLYIVLKTIKIVLLGPAPNAPRPERTPSSRVSPHGSPAAPRVTFANPMRNGDTETVLDASAQARWN
jgi:exopolysaccharide biosynthesis polyprenyl glycosylphosphotransferase